MSADRIVDRVTLKKKLTPFVIDHKMIISISKKKTNSD